AHARLCCPLRRPMSRSLGKSGVASPCGTTRNRNHTAFSTRQTTRLLLLRRVSIFRHCSSNLFYLNSCLLPHYTRLVRDKQIDERLQVRILMRPARPKSEEPLGLVEHGIGWVPKGGFSWVGGRAGPTGRKDRFLIPNSDSGMIEPLPDD